MKKQAIVWFLAVITLLQFSGCDSETNIWGSIKGSGHITEVEYSFDNFKKLDVSHAFQVSVLPSDTFYVVLSVDDNIVKYLDVYKTGDWLVISMEDNKNYNNVHLFAEIHMPVLRELEGSGASEIEISGFSSENDFKVDLSGASVFSGNIEAGDCNIELSGASVINLNGYCSNLNVEASGASVMNLGNFECYSGNFDFSGASNATVYITDYLSATLSGASVLQYYGDPEIGNLNISGASVITKL